MRIAFQLLATLIFLALFPALILGTFIVGIMAIWRNGKAKVKMTPPAKADQAQVPLTADGEAMRNIEWTDGTGQVTWDDVDWSRTAVYDPNKPHGTS